jgi:hypothetical protein
MQSIRVAMAVVKKEKTSGQGLSLPGGKGSQATAASLRMTIT